MTTDTHQPLILKHALLENRLYLLLLFGYMTMEMLQPLWLILCHQNSWTFKVSTLPPGTAWYLAVFALCAAAQLPNIAAIIFDKVKKLQELSRPFAKLSCGGMVLAGFTWAFMSFQSRNFDADYVSEVFAVSSAQAVLFGAIIGISLNHAQQRKEQGQ